MRVGDEVHMHPSDYTPPPQGKGRRQPEAPMMSHAVPPNRAVVEYIHPARRYYAVRFYYEFGSFCECFQIR